MKKRNIILIFSILLLVAVVSSDAAQSSSYSEYDIKAGFIYKFISFVQWPKEKEPPKTITIGIIGKSPFGKAFKDVEGKLVEKRTLVIKFFDSKVDYKTLKQCQILYVSKSEDKKLKAILKAVENLPILTVSDSKGFAEKGGCVGFVKQRGKVKFEINNTSAKKAKLVIRSMLKRIAVRVIDKKDGGGDE